MSEPVVLLQVFRGGGTQNVIISCAGHSYRLTGPRILNPEQVAEFRVEIGELRRRLRQLATAHRKAQNTPGIV